MTASSIIEELQHAGGTIIADGPDLLIQAPRGVLDRLRTELRAHKPEILETLRHRQPEPPAPAGLEPMRKRTPPGPGIYLCGQCWTHFPEAELSAVAERAGRAFRCADCLMKGSSR